MPVPTVITDLSPNEALNSPAGSESVGSPGSVDNYFRAIQAILRNESLAKSWEPRGDVPTYISGTSFSVPGDQTTHYTATRRVQANGATTIYGAIVSSSYNGVITTVVILPDAGVLDATLSSVYLGIDPRAATAPAPGGTGEAYFNAGNTGAALAINWANGQHQQFTLTGNATITLGAGVAPGWHTLRIVQDATGGRTITWAGAAYAASRWIGNGIAPSMDRIIASVCFVRLFWDGTAWAQQYLGSAGRRNTYFALAGQTTSTLIFGPGVSATIAFNGTSSDPYSEWNTTTGVFTAKVAGLYRLDVEMEFSVAVGGQTIFLTPVMGAVGGLGSIYMPTVYNGQQTHFGFSQVANLAAGQQIVVNIQNNTSGNLTVYPGSAAAVTRLGDAQ